MSKAIVITGLFYGDEGKGSITAYLAEMLPDVRVVVRHSGGAQAAHNVVTGDGKHHTFSQFGSGMFTPGVRTHLAYRMMVDPYRIYPEAEHLVSLGIPDVWERLTVDRDCLVTTPMHTQANLLREQERGENIHGSCGLGIGETRWAHNHLGDNAIRIGDLERPAAYLKWKFHQLYALYRDQCGWDLHLPSDADLAVYAEFAERVQLVERDALAGIVGDGTVIFEGAQGVLLDEQHGFQPHTTWSVTTSANARELIQFSLDQDPDDAVYIGVTRTYATRHGAGPFPVEEHNMLIAEAHNNGLGQQGEFRTGPFDAAIAEYVRHIDQPTHLAVTHCDRLDGYRHWGEWPFCIGYTQDQHPIIEHHSSEIAVDVIADTFGAPVLIESYGPRTNDKKQLQLVF